MNWERKKKENGKNTAEVKTHRKIKAARCFFLSFRFEPIARSSLMHVMQITFYIVLNKYSKFINFGCSVTRLCLAACISTVALSVCSWASSGNVLRTHCLALLLPLFFSVLFAFRPYDNVIYMFVRCLWFSFRYYYYFFVIVVTPSSNGIDVDRHGIECVHVLWWKSWIVRCARCQCV